MVAKCRCSPRIRQPPRVPRRPSSRDLPGGFRYLGENDWKTVWAKLLGGGVYRVIQLEDTYEYGYCPIIGDLDLARRDRGDSLDEVLRRLAMNTPLTEPVPTPGEKILAIALHDPYLIEDFASQSFGKLDDAMAWAMAQV